MNKKQKRKTKVIIEGIVSFVLLSLLMVINELTEINFDIEWFKDADVWINDFFVNTFVFFLMSTWLSRIENKYLNFGISYVVSVIIGNFIQLDASNFALTLKSIILIVLYVLALIVWGFNGYFIAKRQNRKEAEKAKLEYENQLVQVDNKVRTELYNLKRFIKKHPKECLNIDRLGVDFVMKFVEDDKNIRNAKKLSNDD